MDLIDAVRPGAAQGEFEQEITEIAEGRERWSMVAKSKSLS